MPFPCFSYSADLPPNVASRRVAQRAPRGPGSMPGYPCFVYPSDIPHAVSSPRRMHREPRHLAANLARAAQHAVSLLPVLIRRNS